MNKSVDILEFKSLSTAGKIEFLNCDLIDSVKTLDDRSINILLREIILDENENTYVRKSTLKIFTELVIVGKLKNRHALSLLIDDWKTSSDAFLELQRLKDLLFYYEESDQEREDIESIFKTGTINNEAEIVGESFFSLGILLFQKALKSINKEEFISALNNSENYFQKSIEEIENRIDSRFYLKVVLILHELLSNRWGSAKQYIKELGNNLFQKEVFSFKTDFDNLQYGFYKIITSLQNICIQQPKYWIDYRMELDKVFLCYTEITNSEIGNRLNEKAILNKLGGYLKMEVLEPFFIINLSSIITKINVMLREKSENTSEYTFLLYLKSIIENTDKKKVEFDSLESKFKNLFPNNNPEQVTKLVRDIKNPIDCFKVFEFLSAKSNDSLINDLKFACSKLQGDKKYWGKKVDENDRNRYIATMLEAAGYTIKDQPQWSSSAEGKGSGEIDVFITESDGTPKSIIEALVLDSLKKEYLILHLDKLFRYDSTGLENNYIITYSLARNFASLWKKYKDFIPNHSYIYKFIDFKEIDYFNFADIKIGVAQHFRNEKVINVYHIMINLVER
tara:strand:- start:8464 stop:10161 length:1698 start_codon:yes stop_codon:yes gene_type:complete